MKTLALGCVLGSLVALAAHAGISAKEVKPRTMRALEQTAMVTFDDVTDDVVVQHIVVPVDIVAKQSSKSSKTYVCSPWRDSLIGGRVKECDWR